MQEEGCGSINEAKEILRFQCPVCKEFQEEGKFVQHMTDVHKVMMMQCREPDCKMQVPTYRMVVHMKFHKSQSLDEPSLPVSDPDSVIRSKSKHRRLSRKQKGSAEQQKASLENLPQSPYLPATPRSASIPAEVLALLSGALQEEVTEESAEDDEIIDLESEKVATPALLTHAQTIANEAAKEAVAAPLYTCRDCGDNFFHTRERDKHRRSVHLSGLPKKVGKGIMCKECFKSFSKLADLSSHVTSVHQGLRYKCNVCNAVYKGRDSVEGHIMVEHSNDSIQNYSTIKM